MSSLKPLSLNKFKQIRKLQQKKYRVETNCFLSEGFRLFNAAIRMNKITIREIIISESFRNTKQCLSVLQIAGERNIGIYKTDDVKIKKISDEVTPPGIIFVSERNKKGQASLIDVEGDLLLYLDRISEPGNMGSILRSACWFGVQTVLLSPDCVDPWNPKSVRASAGTIFELNIFTEIKFDSIRKFFKQKKYQFIATVVSEGIPLNQWKPFKKSIIFLGQEAGGLSKEIVKHADGLINIPGCGKSESLNVSVATGIILYEATKQGFDA